jgi:hypothetical protein
MKARWLILLFAFIVAATLCSFAGENYDGKKLCRENCRECFDIRSMSREYSPTTLIQDQWQRFLTVADWKQPATCR